jgi:hypothetical protein
LQGFGVGVCAMLYSYKMINYVFGRYVLPSFLGQNFFYYLLLSSKGNKNFLLFAEDGINHQFYSFRQLDNNKNKGSPQSKSVINVLSIMKIIIRSLHPSSIYFIFKKTDKYWKSQSGGEFINW